MRMQNRRFTRLTNAFSREAGEPCVSCGVVRDVVRLGERIHKTLSVTLAMQAGLPQLRAELDQL